MSHQSQLYNSTAQAMSTKDMQSGPEATSTTLPIPCFLSCLQRPRSLMETSTKRPFCCYAGNLDDKDISSEHAATQMCVQVKLPPPPFSLLPSCPEPATFLLGLVPRNLLRLRFLWICFLQKPRGHLAKTKFINSESTRGEILAVQQG